MKFYNRQKELEILECHYRRISKASILDVLIGRRRVGKTELAKQFIKKKKTFYFFVTRKPLVGLLLEWGEILRQQYPEIGEFSSLDRFLETIFKLGEKEKLVIVFDEFQNFKYIDPTAFSIFQKFFDQYKKQSKVLLILIGSIVTLMERIFSDAKEPLFGRATRRIYLNPFDISVTAKILRDLRFRNEQDIFNLYSIFDGIPKYLVLIEEEGLQAKSLEKIVTELIISPEANLKKEGEELLKEEFGQDYARYFEILSLIAQGKTKLSEITVGMKLPLTSVSVYLTKLEQRYKLIERRLPIFSKRRARLGRYYVKDIFLIFWFRFVYRYFTLVERNAHKTLWKIIKRDFSTYQGMIFEEVARDFIVQENNKLPLIIEEIGRYWDRKGKNEIDIVAVDKGNKKVFLAECKLNPKRVTKQVIDDLVKKSYLEEFKKFKKRYLGIVTLGRLGVNQRKWLKENDVLEINFEEWLS